MAAWVSAPAVLGRKPFRGVCVKQVSFSVSRSTVVRRCPRASIAPRVDPRENRNPGKDVKSDLDEPLGPSEGNRFGISRWGEGIRGDLRRRLPLYLSDWLDGLDPKSIPTVLFMYCACLAPVVAFGGLSAALTGGSMGVVEFLLASGGVGMAYSVLSGQPLTFLAPTGLTLAFTVALYNFCIKFSFPFLATYAWVGIWTSIILLVLAVSNSSDAIRHCTRFTDDVFNSLIATNFIYEALKSLGMAFFVAAADKTRSFTGLALALGTLLLSRILVRMRSSRYFTKRIRSLLSDFGPLLAVILMSCVGALPAITSLGLAKLQIPATLSLAGGRDLFIPLFTTPLIVRLAAIIPALLLTCLFFLDQNISVRIVNAPQRKLRKGPAYHVDMLALAICTFACSITAMPLMCAGTVQSLAHVQALSRIEQVDGKERVVSVVENRLSAFLIHLLIACSVLLLPIVEKIPYTVLLGLFLFLGVQMLDDNEFLRRIPYLFIMEPKQYPDDSPMRKAPVGQVHAFTLLQLTCLSFLWVLKLNKSTAMLFPSVIAMLLWIRISLAPKMFPATTLAVLDSDVVGEAK